MRSLPSRQLLLSCLIEQLLREGSWNQTSLSRALGVSNATVNRWLNGVNLPDPTSNNFKVLAQVSGGTPETLLTYLEGKISLQEYRQGAGIPEWQRRKPTLEEILADISLLEPTEIVSLIASSAALLANKSISAN
ncbi:helix-turn-helix domain-containing protein [Aerosakkonemataceae cyanobacterium BLCC-F50]|uniref:Helix-turn-helix domain-containing protein n=1 Tax=Floridaenema flaviceps BLCC-F50 TaxID=3153642 RepID=A0ABV4XUD6_9CYAN